MLLLVGVRCVNGVKGIEGYNDACVRARIKAKLAVKAHKLLLLCSEVPCVRWPSIIERSGRLQAVGVSSASMVLRRGVVLTLVLTMMLVVVAVVLVAVVMLVLVVVFVAVVFVIVVVVVVVAVMMAVSGAVFMATAITAVCAIGDNGVRDAGRTKPHRQCACKQARRIPSTQRPKRFGEHAPACAHAVHVLRRAGEQRHARIVHAWARGLLSRAAVVRHTRVRAAMQCLARVRGVGGVVRRQWCA